MRFKLKRGKGEEGLFKTCEFWADPEQDGFFQDVLEKVNQAVWPFVKECPDYKKIVKEVLITSDANELCRVLDLENMEKEDLIIIRNAIEVQLSIPKPVANPQPKNVHDQRDD